MKKIIIIGGTAAGVSAAARLAKLNPEDEIILFEEGENISCASCGLPYYLGGVIQERSKLILHSPKSFEKRFGVEVRSFSKVIKIDKYNKKISIEDILANNVYEEYYEKLIIATGSKPWNPRWPGQTEASNIYSLKTVKDADKILNRILHDKAQNIVVAGASAVGVEVAENLSLRGLNITIINEQNTILDKFDPEIAKVVELDVIQRGIKVLNNSKIEKVLDNGETIILESGEKINTDMIIIALGTRPRVSLARSAGLEIGETGAIKVNKHMKTSNHHIFAIGDCVEIRNSISKQKIVGSLAAPAHKQARVAADNMNGNYTEYTGTLESRVMKVFDLTIATTGLNAKQLNELGYDFNEVYVERRDHATYYPGSKYCTVKLMYCPATGQIYGAQGVGELGVDKRINIITAAIHGHMTIDELANLDIPYSPPFGSPKDIVNVIAHEAQNNFFDDDGLK